jgi:Fe-S-cluster-containing hydrogenase component 2
MGLMEKRIFIDLDKCSACAECSACCDYFYNKTPGGGVVALREYAAFSLFCRHCEKAPCVSACYHDALEKQPDGHLKRYMMLCTSCKSCSIACPFGTILPDVIPYLSLKCDFCRGRAGEIPLCVSSCPEKAVEYRQVSEDPDNNIYLIGEKLAVKSKKWTREG